MKHAHSSMIHLWKTPLPNKPTLTFMRITMEEPIRAKAKVKEKAKIKAKEKEKAKAKAKAKVKVHGTLIRTVTRTKTQPSDLWRIRTSSLERT